MLWSSFFRWRCRQVLPQMVSAGHKMFPKGDRRRSLKQLQEKLSAEKIEEFTEDFLRVLEQGNDDATRIVDKMPNNARFVGLIERTVPRPLTTKGEDADRIMMPFVSTNES